MKPAIIVNGNFSKAGNFTAITTTGESFFVKASQMESIGMASPESVKFPIFAFTDTKMRNFRDGEGNLKEVAEPRLEALSLFKTEAERAAAYALENTQNISLNKAVKEAYSAAGLTEDEVTALANQVW